LSDAGAPPPLSQAVPPPEQSATEVIIARIFEHIPHPRYEHHNLVGPTTRAQAAEEVHGSGFWGRFNAKLGLKITIVVGSMWCAYIFLLITILSLPQAITSHNLVIIVAWISSNFLQLVLLPIIIVGQNIQATASDKRAEDTYKDAEAIMHECMQLQAHLQAQDKLLLDLIEHVHQLGVSVQETAAAS